MDVIKPLIEYGHLHYGENKVQEAVRKWTEIKKNNEVLPWKKFNSNMAISVEYDLEY